MQGTWIVDVIIKQIKNSIINCLTRHMGGNNSE